ncbi:MAG: ABC transporter substrate-binding protein, partial [Deltaproteobacteria bacterium]|nr:ABC transporter substrate-binding protein [Deltaproteobacteria bacterium]
VLLSCAAAVSTVVATVPAPADPMTVLKTGIDQVMTVFNDRQMPLDQRREKLRSIASQYLDFESMAKSVLGYHWRSLTAAQRDEFVPLFSEFIQDAYLSKMEQTTVEKIRQEANTANVRFVKQTYFSSNYAEVFSTVALQDRQDPLEINFLMHQDGGQWRVYDVTVDSISLVTNYQNQFNRVINNEGYQKLVADLQAKRDQLRQYMNQEVRDSAAH